MPYIVVPLFTMSRLTIRGKDGQINIRLLLASVSQSIVITLPYIVAPLTIVSICLLFADLQFASFGSTHCLYCGIKLNDNKKGLFRDMKDLVY